jgi:transposase InsO family protein
MRYQIAINPRSQADHWRNLAIYWMVSSQAKARLEWMIFYHDVAKRNASYTASYFGISRKTLHKWIKRFDPQRIQSLEERTRRPKRLRTWEVTPTQEQRIIKLRQRHTKYGKTKLKILYEKQYGESISTWKIERVVRKHNLYSDPEEQKKRIKRRRKNKSRTRIHELDTSQYPAGTLWHTDTIILWWYGQYRVIFTAIEDKTKLGYARVYPSHSSRNAKDFLERLLYLSDASITVMHSDNGSEFAGEFEKACKLLGIEQVYNRVRQPKDNPALERFNRTLQEEWLELSEVGLDEIQEANTDLTEWLVEYNFKRPHQSLDYQTPVEYAQQTYFSKVLPMYPARTTSSLSCYNYFALRIAWAREIFPSTISISLRGETYLNPVGFGSTHPPGLIRGISSCEALFVGF